MAREKKFCLLIGFTQAAERNDFGINGNIHFGHFRVELFESKATEHLMIVDWPQ